MPNPPTATDVLEREFLPIRAKLLEIASALDRYDRAESTPSHDARLDSIRRGIEVLLEEGPDRAEQIQMIFSRVYQPDWRKRFDLA